MNVDDRAEVTAFEAARTVHRVFVRALGYSGVAILGRGAPTEIAVDHVVIGTDLAGGVECGGANAHEQSKQDPDHPDPHRILPSLKNYKDGIASLLCRQAFRIYSYDEA
jgi:hypothetical protein